MIATDELAGAVGVVAACLTMMIPRASFSRRRRPRHGPPRRRATPARALSIQDRDCVLEVLHSEEFVDQSPQEVYATLLARGAHLCSVRTMYRILDAEGETGERRAQRTHPEYRKPELLATGPNQVWSWDITRVRGPRKWTYYYLYVVLDIFSRYVVGWMVADHENATLAKRLLTQTFTKQAIEPGQLIIHQDRGAPMTSKTVLQMYADLSVGPSYSRPHVSDDNPYSEAHFKTLKYRPGYPDRFGSKEDVHAFCRPFFSWYNTEHHHSGIAYMTPASVHYGLADSLQLERQSTLNAAFAAHPERFVNGPPRAPERPREAWINPPASPGDPITPGPAQPTKATAEERIDGLESNIPKNEAPGRPRFDDLHPARPVPSPQEDPPPGATPLKAPCVPPLTRPLPAAAPLSTTVAH